MKITQGTLTKINQLVARLDEAQQDAQDAQIAVREQDPEHEIDHALFSVKIRLEEAFRLIAELRA